MIALRFELNTSLVSSFICSINGSRDPARFFTPLKTAKRYLPGSPVWKMPPLFNIYFVLLGLHTATSCLSLGFVSLVLLLSNGFPLAPFDFFPHLFPPDSTCFSSGQDMFLCFAYVNLGSIQHIETKHLHVLCYFY